MKKWTKKLVIGIAISCMAITAAGCGSSSGTGQSGQAPAPAAADNGIKEHKIKLGFATTEDHPQGLAAKKFKELVEQKSGGKITVSLYGNATLGDDKKMQEALAGGLQEAMIGGTSTLVGDVQELGVLDLPYLFTSEQEADAVLDGQVGKDLMAKLPEHGLVGLGFMENGFRNVTNNERPITKMEDLAGLKIRVMQSPVYIEMFKALGANPTPLAFSEVYSALESKTIDAQENPFVMIETQKYYEVQKYLSITKHSYNAFIMTMSKKFWDQLSEQEKALVQEAATEACLYQRDITRQQNAELVKKLEERGMVINEVSAEEIARMQAQLKPVVDELAKKFGETTYKAIQDELSKN